MSDWGPYWAIGLILASVGLICAVFAYAGLKDGYSQGVSTVCREAGYYNTLESCKGVTYAREGENQ